MNKLVRKHNVFFLITSNLAENVLANHSIIIKFLNIITQF